MAVSSTLKDRLGLGEFVFTAEITPPLSADPADLKRIALPLQGIADAVNVTDAASSRVHMGALAAASLLASWGIDPILQMTCRDRNRIALQGDLVGAAALGIRNLLFLGGDDPKAGDQPDAKPVFDLDAIGLAETARRMRDEGTLPTGRAIAGKCDFLIGGVDAPIDPPASWRPDRLAAKHEAGMGFVQTQFCMDGSLLRRYMARLADAGLVPSLHYIVGIAPLPSAKSARWMREKLFGTIIPDAIVARMEGAKDPVAEGSRICLELIAEFSTIEGISGVHIMTPRNQEAIPDLIRDAKAELRRV
jgi:methylenetetrahydrofolate reductase (NADPH)